VPVGAIALPLPVGIGCELGRVGLATRVVAAMPAASIAPAALTIAVLSSRAVRREARQAWHDAPS
jgi:hypothetical protein